MKKQGTKQICGDNMGNLIIGFVLGVIISTVGFSNFASFTDRQIESMKVLIKENVK
jgi:hypothetical protein